MSSNKILSFFLAIICVRHNTSWWTDGLPDQLMGESLGSQCSPMAPIRSISPSAPIQHLVYIVRGTAAVCPTSTSAQPLAPPTQHAISPGHQGKDGEQIFTKLAKFWFIILSWNSTFSWTKSSEMESSYKMHSM